MSPAESPKAVMHNQCMVEMKSIYKILKPKGLNWTAPPHRFISDVINLMKLGPQPSLSHLDWEKDIGAQLDWLSGCREYLQQNQNPN